MASALQRLFKKKLGKQREQRRDGEQKGRQALSQTVSSGQHAPEADRRQSYFTVDSLNSPLPASRMSTASPSFFPGAPSSDHALSRTNSSNHGHGHRRGSFGIDGMLRHDSGTARQWAAATMGDSTASIPVNQFGNIMSPLRGPKSSCSSHNIYSFADSETEHSASRPPSEDEDDITANPIYVALFDQVSLAQTLAHTKIILLPSAESLSTAGRLDLLRDSAYVASHAFTSSELFKGQFESRQVIVDESQTPISVSLSAVLHPERHTVKLMLSSQKRNDAQAIRREFDLKVQEETTAFHSLRNRDTNRKERIRIRVLTVDGFVLSPVVYDSVLARPTENVEDTKAKGLRIDRSTVSTEAGAKTKCDFNATAANTNGQKVDSIPSHRVFVSDYAWLLRPGEDVAFLHTALREAFKTLKRAADGFTNAYIYVAGFDNYNVSRIRRGILARAWQTFEDARAASCDQSLEHATNVLGHNWRQRLLLVLENVVMGLCHGKVYGSLRMTMQEQDDRFDALLVTYRDAGLAIKEFDTSSALASHATLQSERALESLARLGSPEEDLQDVLQHSDIAEVQELASKVQKLAASALLTPAEPGSDQEIRAMRTPLDVLETMTVVARCLAGCDEKRLASSSSASLSTDALLPLLAFVIVKACPGKLTSTLYYVRLFGISDATPAEHSWALTTFETAVEYLKGDPLKLGGDVPQVTPPGTLMQRRDTASSRLETPSTSHRIATLSPANSQHRGASSRDRHISLPGGSRPTMGINSVRQGKEVDRTYIETDAGHFKLPDLPASATKSCDSRSIGSCSSASHRADSSAGRHERSPSMSKEVAIRPQIVVRMRPPISSHLSPRSGTFERAQSETDAFAYRTSTMAVKQGETASPSRPQLSRLDTRRKSLDSSTTLSIFSALGFGQTAVPARDDRQIASAIERTEENPFPSQTIAPGPTSTIKVSSSQMSRTISAPLAEREEPENSSLPPALLRSDSSRSANVSSLDSLPSLDTHATSTEGHGSELSTSPRRQVASVQFPLQTIRDDSATEPDTATPSKSASSSRVNKPSKRSRRRSRLLSITGIGQVTPNQFTADAATALATPTNVERMWSDVDKGGLPGQSWLQKVATADNARAAKLSIEREVDAEENLADVTTETVIDHWTAPRTARSQDTLFGSASYTLKAAVEPPDMSSSSAHVIAAPRKGAAPSLRLLIPTPIEEIADPISLHSSHV